LPLSYYAKFIPAFQISTGIARLSLVDRRFAFAVYTANA
jgi:hypothetical protein